MILRTRAIRQSPNCVLLMRCPISDQIRLPRTECVLRAPYPPVTMMDTLICRLTLLFTNVRLLLSLDSLRFILPSCAPL